MGFDDIKSGALKYGGTALLTVVFMKGCSWNSARIERNELKKQQTFDRAVLAASTNKRENDPRREGVISVDSSNRVVVPVAALRDLNINQRKSTLRWAFQTNAHIAHLGNVTFNSAVDNIDGRCIYFNMPLEMVGEKHIDILANRVVPSIVNSDLNKDTVGTPYVDFHVTPTDGKISVKFDPNADGGDDVKVLETFEIK